MGACAGKQAGPYEEFVVTNINDEHRLVHKGIMFVTDTDLIYIDSKSRDRWEWPLMYLRRYGCEGHVFSFEAGRKCPSGEGLYAFKCSKARALFNKVAQNISQSNIRPGESEHPEAPTENAQVPFPPKQPPSGANQRRPGTSLPSIPNPSPPTPPPPSPKPPQGKGTYTNLEFEQNIDYMPPPQTDHIPYAQIDMPRTIEAGRIRQKFEHSSTTNGDLPKRHASAPGKRPRHKGGSRSSSCSSSSSLNTDHHQVRLRSLDEDRTEHKNQRRGSAPDPNERHPRTSSPQLPATVREVPTESEPNYINVNVGANETSHSYTNLQIEGGDQRATVVSSSTTVREEVEVEVEHNHPNTVSEPNYSNINVGGVGGGAAELSESNYINLQLGEGGGGGASETGHNYTNINVGPGGQDTSEHNYFNLNVGGSTDDSLRVSSPSLLPHPQESNYQNLIPGQGLVSSTPMTTPTQKQAPDVPQNPSSPSFLQPRSLTFNHTRNRSPDTTGSTSTLPHIKGGGDTMQTYVELDISTQPAASSSSYAELEITNGQQTSLFSPPSEDKRERSRSKSTSGILEETSDPTYKELNFNEMRVLYDLKSERSHQKENVVTEKPKEKDHKKGHRSKNK